MKAKELMIGDWVRCQYTPFQVEGIEHRNKRYTVTGDGFNTNVAGVHPIPLSAEILEKNGFEHKTDIVWHDIYVLRYRIELANKELERDHLLMLAKDPYDVFYWVPEMSAVSALNFRYVHELQHLMKMLQIEKEVEL